MLRDLEGDLERYSKRAGPRASDLAWGVHGSRDRSSGALMTSILGFASEPEPTDWCNVRFVVSVSGRQSPIVVWLGLANDRACQNRDAYARSGENDSVGHIPTGRVAHVLVDRNTLAVVLDLDGQRVEGELTETLGWTCSTLEPRVWSTARYVAIDYALSQLTSLEEKGFDTSLLRRA